MIEKHAYEAIGIGVSGSSGTESSIQRITGLRRTAPDPTTAAQPPRREPSKMPQRGHSLGRRDRWSIIAPRTGCGDGAFSKLLCKSARFTERSLLG